MPDEVTITEVAPPPPPVTETVTATPTPAETPTAVMDPELADSMRSMIDGVNGLNAQFEGTTQAGPLVLDADQFGVLIVALSLLIALAACAVVIGLRR